MIFTFCLGSGPGPGPGQVNTWSWVHFPRQEKQFLFSLSRRWPPGGKRCYSYSRKPKTKAKVAADRLGCHSSSGNWQLAAGSSEVANCKQEDVAASESESARHWIRVQWQKSWEKDTQRERKIERETERGRALALGLWSEAHPTNVKSS